MEVEESLACLRGGGAQDLRDLVILQGALLLTSAGRVESLDRGRERMGEVLDTGAALEKFRQMVIRQVRSNCSGDSIWTLIRGLTKRLLRSSVILTLQSAE